MIQIQLSRLKAKKTREINIPHLDTHPPKLPPRKWNPHPQHLYNDAHLLKILKLDNVCFLFQIFLMFCMYTQGTQMFLGILWLHKCTNFRYTLGIPRANGIHPYQPHLYNDAPLLKTLKLHNFCFLFQIFLIFCVYTWGAQRCPKMQ